jgi:hypothetical protein
VEVEMVVAAAAMDFQEVLEVELVTGVEPLREQFLLEEQAQQGKVLTEEAVYTKCQTMVLVEVVVQVGLVPTEPRLLVVMVE